MNLKDKTSSLFILVISFLFCNACSSSKKEVSQTAGGAGLPEFVIDSRYVTALLNGQSALLRDDFVTAQKAFSSCLVLKPNDAEALFRLSQTERKLGNNNVATDLAAKACEYNLQHIYWYNLHYAELLDNKGDYEQSAFIIQEALAKNPEVEFLYTKSDSAWQRIEEYKKAEKVWEMHKVNFPDKNKVADYHLIGIYEKQNKKSEALSLAKKLFEIEPENGRFAIKYIYSLEDKEQIKKLLEQYSTGNLIQTEKPFFYENAYFLSHKLEEIEITFNYALLNYTHSDKVDTKFIFHFEEQLLSGYFTQKGVASKLKIVAQNRTQNAHLQYLTAIQMYVEYQIVESISFFENCSALGYSDFNFYLIYAQALYNGGRFQSLTELTSDAVQAFPLAAQFKYYRTVSLIGKPGFEDWMDETLPFTIDASDKLFFAKMKTLHQTRIENKTIGNEFFEGSSQLNELSKELLLRAVLLSGKTSIDKTLFEKINAGTAFPNSLLMESIWLLNNNQPIKAVEMLKNKEANLSSIPLFCRINALALYEVGQIKEAKIWNQKAFDAKLDKDLLLHLNNGKEF